MALQISEKIVELSKQPWQTLAPLFRQVLDGEITAIEPGDDVSTAVFEIEMIYNMHALDCVDLETASANIQLDNLHAIFNGRWMRYERSQGLERFRRMTEGGWDAEIQERWTSGIQHLMNEVRELQRAEEAVEARIAELEKDRMSTQMTTLLHEWRCRQLVWRLTELRICITEGFEAFRLAERLGSLPWQQRE